VGVGRGATTLPCKKIIVEKPPRNSAFLMEEGCGGDQGPSWAVEPGGGGRERERWENNIRMNLKEKE
jgi:hypothetical protein